MTLIDEMRKDIKNLGGSCLNYQPGQVAWNDGKRAVSKNSLNYPNMVTSIGSCITDTRVESKDGEFLPFLKPENLNETLGVTSASNILFTDKNGNTVTAQYILENAQQYIGYNGYSKIDTKVSKDEKVVVRVQSTFVPLKKGSKKLIVPSHYSYQTFDDDNPCNVIITGTPTGIYGQCDATGINKLYGHSLEVDGTINNHWFEAVPTKYGIGMHQHKEDNSDQYTANPVQLGFKEMGATCNTFLVMSFQREQPLTNTPRNFLLSADPYNECHPAPIYRSCSSGVTSAARLNLDKNIVGQKKLSHFDAIRKNNCPIMLTIHKYYTTEYETGNFKVQPSDIAMAIGDMENIYKLCDQSGKLSNLPVMQEVLTQDTINTFHNKLKNDPVSDPYSFV